MSSDVFYAWDVKLGRNLHTWDSQINNENVSAKKRPQQVEVNFFLGFVVFAGRKCLVWSEKANLMSFADSKFSKRSRNRIFK